MSDNDVLPKRRIAAQGANYSQCSTAPAPPTAAGRVVFKTTSSNLGSYSIVPSGVRPGNASIGLRRRTANDH